jgi:hypothetical protein
LTKNGEKYFDYKNHVTKCLHSIDHQIRSDHGQCARQRASGEIAGGLRNQKPDLREGEAQPPVDRGSTRAQSAKIQDPGLGRARVWIHGKLNKRDFPAVHWVEESFMPDRLSEHGLQHVPLQPTHPVRANQNGIKPLVALQTKFL